MASTFNNMDRASAESLMLVHSEPITYYPRAGGSRGPLDAIIERLPVGTIPGGNTPMARIMVQNDDTRGISSAEFDRGGDRIGYPVNIGASASIRPAKQMPSQTAGMILLEVL